MTVRKALWIVVAAFAVLAGVVLYIHKSAAAECDSEPALGRVYAILRDQFHLDSIFLNDVKTVSGGYFSDSQDCSAEVTEIKGNVTMVDMPWREITYRVGGHEDSPDVTVTLGGSVPLAPEPPSRWTRLLAHF